MARRTRAILGLVVGLMLATDLLALPAVAAQQGPTVPVVAPIVAGVVVPPVVVSLPGSRGQRHRADVDMERQRSRTPGQVVVR
jgi:hypothetical protein